MAAWHNTLSFLLRVRLHNLGATRWSPTEKWDCSQMLQASWSVCWSCFGFSSPTQCVPWEVELIMFFNTKVRSKFMEHVSHYKRNQLFGQHYLWVSVWGKVKTQSNYKSLSKSFGYVLLLFFFSHKSSIDIRCRAKGVASGPAAPKAFYKIQKFI